MNSYLSCLAKAVCALTLAGTLSAAEPDLATLQKQFSDLPMEARRPTGPLFRLHSDKSKEKQAFMVEKVAEGGNGIFTAEPRPHKDWLGPGWYRDLDICLQVAKKNDLKMIIYDDYSWPSQIMGGRVPPQYGSKGWWVLPRPSRAPGSTPRAAARARNCPTARWTEPP